MSSSLRSFGFAFVMCVVVSFLLTAASTSLKDRQTFNIANDKKKNILKALAVLERGQKYSGSEIEQLYTDNVQDKWLLPTGEVVDISQEGGLPIYISYDGDDVQKYALPTSGKGLWSTVYGFIALEGDGETVAGFSVYQHGETPGLGGEVEKDWFQLQFVGKKITDLKGQFISVTVLKGKVVDTTLTDSEKLNYVDGMSGATITTKGVSDFIKADLEKYESFSKRLREG